jgi:hypothetical protein
VNFLKKIAPFITTGLGLAGPYGAIASKLLAPILGVKPNSSDDDYAAALAKATPEQIEAIKQAEQQYQLQMKQLDIQSVEDMEKIAADDRASARNREVELAKAGARDRTNMILAFTITIGFFATLWFVFVHGVRPEVHDVAIGMVATLGTAWIGVVTYYFGSSKGSDDKTRIIGDIAKS